MSPWTFVAGAIGALGLWLAARAAVRWRKRRAIAAMKEPPWSPQARALLAEPIGLNDDEMTMPGFGVGEPDTRVPPDAAGMTHSTRWLVNEIFAATRGHDAPENHNDAQEATLKRREGKQVLQTLKTLLYELPMTAGDAPVAQTLAGVAAGALRYYRYGVSTRELDLPVGASRGDRESAGSDVSQIAGYLELEQRLGRLPDDLEPLRFGSALLGAMAARALGLDGGGAGSDEEYARLAVRILLSKPIPEPDEIPVSEAAGGSPSPALAVPPGSPELPEPPVPARIVGTAGLAPTSETDTRLRWTTDRRTA